jgi:TRAP-type C4-dicarboxylate transport system permease small subunit
MGDDTRAALPGTAVADWTTRFLAYVAGAALLWLMLLTVVAVVMRYVFNAPILGAQDISELSLAVVVFLGIPYCGWTGGHVAVDLISTVVGEARLRYTDTLMRLLGAVLFAVVAWQAMDQGLDALEYGEASNLVEIAHHPFMFLMSFGWLLFALVLLLQAAAGIFRPPETPQEKAE